MMMSEGEFQMADLCVPSESHSQDEALTVLEKGSSEAEQGKYQSLKKPRRVLHFSDGTMEECSSDEDDVDNKPPEPDTLKMRDPKSLTWGPWMYYWMLYSGSSALSVCDYVGEGLANFLGITSPKYQYEIDEYARIQEEEKAEREEEEAQMSGWTTSAAVSPEDSVKHDVNSSTVLQSPVQSQALDQVKCEFEVPSGAEESPAPVSDAGNSAAWDRF